MSRIWKGMLGWVPWPYRLAAFEGNARAVSCGVRRKCVNAGSLAVGCGFRGGVKGTGTGARVPASMSVFTLADWSV